MGGNQEKSFQGNFGGGGEVVDGFLLDLQDILYHDSHQAQQTQRWLRTKTQPQIFYEENKELTSTRLCHCEEGRKISGR